MLRRREVLALGPRRGIILLVVLALLALFATLGLSFVLYAGSEATSARLAREAESISRPDVQPELLLGYFLGQLLYDTADDPTGMYSALRGHSLARSLYGYPDDVSAASRPPFTGTGRLHGPSPLPGVDDYLLLNYTYFPADGFVRDPERGGVRLNPTQPRGPFTGGFNPPYTYPDVNNVFLAAMRADGTVLVPSFHRPWVFNPGYALNDLANPNWYNREGKYLLLRPRPVDMGPGFPYPEDDGGDVKNALGSPGGNDSVWLDLDFPVLTAADGRKYKPLFAPLVLDLDNRVNVNVHGNVRGAGLAHASNQGWGPWEVNLGRVLAQNDPSGQPEWPRLFTGRAPGDRTGRYGADQRPGLAGSVAVFGPRPHFYGQVDFDAVNEGWGGAPTGRLLLPLAGLSCFPLYPPGYGNGSALEGRDHAQLYAALASAEDEATDDRRFDVSNLETLLRYGETGAAGLASELAQRCPASLSDPRARRLVTTHSFDLPKPGASVGLDWRVLPLLDRLDLNRPLPPFPHQGSGNGHTSGPALVWPHDRFDTPAAVDQFQEALFERQQWADRLYRLFLAVTGVPAPAQPAAPTDEELLPRRWLAQLAVNIVDFLDDDDISTPFNFYTPQDAYPSPWGRPTDEPPFNVGAGAPDAPRYWVFGTELPHVLVNEVLAERTPSSSTVSVWVELCNPFAVPAGAVNVQALDHLPVPLGIPALGGPSLSTSGHRDRYASYQIVLASQPGPEAAILAQTDDTDDFTTPGQRIDGLPQPLDASVGAVRYLPAPDAAAGMSFLLVGPPERDAHHAIVAGPVPNETPLVKTPRLRYVADPGSSAVTVALRRLANPHLPPDPNPTVPGPEGAVLLNTWYNPYVTIDYLADVPLHNTVSPVAYASFGKQQPYAAHPSQCGDQKPAAGAPQTRHTFGRVNRPLPPGGRYDWLVHLDRPLVSPMELLHVSDGEPSQLTQRFLTGSTPDQRFTHRAPWFDQKTDLYRALEFLETRSRAAGLADAPKLPGKVNLNTVWDVETLLALLDPQPGNFFTEQDVRDAFASMIVRRSPDGRPGPNDRPFLSLATGPRADGGGIESTLLRSDHGTGGRRLFESDVPAGTPANDPSRHPYVQYEMLTKLFNNVTTRSNVFAVWVTVGFFAVTDATTRPVKLGAEIGRAEGRPVRHRLFAIVDRTGLPANPRPVVSFEPSEDRAVLYRSLVD